MEYGLYSVHLYYENVPDSEASNRDLVVLVFVLVIMIFIYLIQSKILNASLPLSSTLSSDDCHDVTITKTRSVT